MSRLLNMEADFKTLQVVYNSMEDPKNERLKLRETLCPALGRLYPLYFHHLKNVDTLEEMRDVVKGFTEFHNLLQEVPEPGRITESYGKTLEDIMYNEEVKELSDSFDQ